MSRILENNKEWIESTWEKVDNKLKKLAVKSYDKIPYTTVNGVHDDRKGDIYMWTNGFWGGLMWLMYNATGNEDYKKTAIHSAKYVDKGLEYFEHIYHDVGFMSHILNGANYRLTGDKEARNTNLFMAAALASRYNIDGKYIRAWNVEGADGWSIIDCMMNIPLLYWASEELGDLRYKRIAMSHTDMAIRDHLRPDGAVNHIVMHNTEADEVLGVFTNRGFDQGYGEMSCWSRGLAWAVYGITLSYIHSGKQEYLDAAKRAANYFITAVAATDYKALADFAAPAEPVYYDSTAGVCAACGMIEIAKYVTETERDMYLNAAIKILKATDENFCDYTDEEDALVKMGSERYPLEEKDFKGIHIPIIYGDFFYVEALLKLKGSDFLIW